MNSARRVASPGLEAPPAVLLDQERVELPEGLPGEGPLEAAEAGVVMLRRLRPLVRVGPLAELLRRLFEGEILPLPADPRLALEGRGPLRRRQLPGRRPVDALPEPELMPLPVMPEVEPPGPPQEVDAVAASCHGFSLLPPRPSAPLRLPLREAALTERQPLAVYSGVGHGNNGLAVEACRGRHLRRLRHLFCSGK